ncbi:MAG: hypothetical protein CMH98_03550 [Oceanospirillaceae bacterium]|nr:hypothetical protein [Oceanospirillaceae bacterium]
MTADEQSRTERGRFFRPRFWLKAGIILLLTLLLTGLLLGLLPSLLKPLLNRHLPHWLGNNASLQIDTFDWHTLTLSRFQLALEDGTLVRIENLDLNYSPLSLASGRFHTLTVDKLTLNLARERAEEVAQEAASDARDAARRRFNQPFSVPAFSQWLSLPAEQIDIHSIHLIHPQLSLQLTADITPRRWHLAGDLQLNDQPLPWDLEARLQQNGDWLLMLSEQQTLLTQMFGHIEQDAEHTRLSLHHRADLAAIHERLPQLQDIPLPLKDLLLQADIEIPNDGVLPRDAVVGAVLTINTQAADLPGNLRWQEGEWLLSLTKTSAAGDWLYRFDGRPQTLRVEAAALPEAVLKKPQPLLITSSQTLSGQCSATLDQCAGEGLLNNQLTSIARQSYATLDIHSSLQWQASDGASVRLPTQMVIRPELSALTDLPVQSARLNGELQASLSPAGQWQLRSDQGFVSQLNIIPGDPWQPLDLTLDIVPQLSMSGNLSDLTPQQLAQRSRAANLPLKIQVRPFTLKSKEQNNIREASTLIFKPAELSCQPFFPPTGIRALCDVKLALAKSSLGEWPVPDAQFSGPLTVSYGIRDSLIARNSSTIKSVNNLSGRFDVTAANQQAALRLRIQHDLDSGKGSLQWHLKDTRLDWDDMQLAEMLPLTKVEFLSGSIAGQGWTDWQISDQGTEITPDLMLRADNLSLTYDSSIALDQWNGLFALRRPFRGDYLLDAQVSGKSLNPGVELSDILARSQTRIPADFSYVFSDIYEVHTDVLGGRVHIPEVKYDSRKDINAFGIELEHIQMAKLAALEASAEVNATGTLDGVLPVVLTPQGVQVPGGALFAREPGGTIRYNNATSQSLGQTNQAVNLAMTALENFRYDTLKSDIKYAEDGALTLGLQFQGKNPDFFDGQKTNLNVSLEYNLLDLLESLRIANDTISKLEEKYQ